MRKKGKIAAFVAAAAVVAGAAAPAAAAGAATGRDGAGPPASVAFTPGSGQSVVDTPTVRNAKQIIREYERHQETAP